MLRHINLAVRQDIQDELIREGMIPRKDRGSKELKEATENLNKLRQRDNANIDSKMRRPPELWNYPKVFFVLYEIYDCGDFIKININIYVYISRWLRRNMILERQLILKNATLMAEQSNQSLI